MYQILMRPEKISSSILINFGPGFICYEPLGAETALASSSFPISVSYSFGDVDWMRRLEGDAPQKVIDINPHRASKLHILPDSDHNMHMDNPEACANIIINDLLGEHMDITPRIGPQIDYQNEFQ